MVFTPARSAAAIPSDRRYYFTPDSVLHSWGQFHGRRGTRDRGRGHPLGRSGGGPRDRVGRNRGGAPRRREHIEHGDGMTDSLLDVLVAKGSVLGADGDGAYYVAGPRGGVWGPMVEHQRRAFTRGSRKASGSC